MDKSKYYGIFYVSRHDKNIANKKFIALLYTALKPIHKEFNTLQMIFTMGITGRKVTWFRYLYKKQNQMHLNYYFNKLHSSILKFLRERDCCAQLLLSQSVDQ